MLKITKLLSNLAGAWRRMEEDGMESGREGIFRIFKRTLAFTGYHMGIHWKVMSK